MYMFYLNRILPALATLVSRDRTGAYRYLPSSVISFYASGAVQAGLRESGFSRTCVHSLSLGIVAVYVAHKVDCPGRDEY
jgi:demethylmenaquinone methyltransferase / 2-methoxy-6-polyprenyl-1,4-benzoquinol methylase